VRGKRDGRKQRRGKAKSLGEEAVAVRTG